MMMVSAETTTTADPQTYEIRTVHDFLRVPEDRRRVCLREFGIWVDLVAATLQVMSGIPIEPPDAFVWIDDDKHEVDLSIACGDNRIHIASGVMREFVNDVPAMKDTP